MESLSRPPHRRKHSSTNSFSFKNPYGDVFLSNGGDRESLEAHEYAEIFSRSSSIPVIDLSGLDERVGPGDCRSSKLDYSNIFGGFRNDDVAVRYEELFNGSAKKSKLRNPLDTRGSDSLHSSEKPEIFPSEASNKSVDGVKKQFNVSFNKTSQKNTDAANGKTHVAQLKAVSGFAYFVDGTPRKQKTEDGKTVNSLRRDVSRTRSFSAEVETVKGKGGLNRKDSHIPDKLHNENEVILKSNFTELPPFSSSSSHKSGNMDLRQSRESNFVAENDASEVNAGEYSPPHFGENLDENSVAAASAAALKKAIDQAQESIRLAKMIMGRKMEGYQNGSKPRQRGRLEVSDKEGKTDRGSYGSKRKNSKEIFEELDPTFTIFNEIDGKLTPSLSHNNNFSNAAKIEVERVWENVEAAKEHETIFSEGGKLYSSNGNQRESLYNDQKVELEKYGENVEAEEAEFPILIASQCKIANLVSDKVGNINSLLPSTSKLESHPGKWETGEDNLEEREATVYQTKGPEVVGELVERPLNTSQRVNVEDAEQCQATFDCAQGPEKNKVERVLVTSQITRGQEKVLGESGKNLGISQDNDVSEVRENDVDNKGNQEPEEMLNLENLMALRSKLDNFVHESCNLGDNGIPGQVETEKKSEIVSERKENGHIGENFEDEGHLFFESEDQLNEALDDEIYETGSGAFPEIGEVGNSFGETLKLETEIQKQNHAHDGENQKRYHAHDGDEPEIEIDVEIYETGSGAFPEIGEVENSFGETLKLEIEIPKHNHAHDGENQKRYHAHDGDEPRLPGELEHNNKVEERHMNTSEMGAKNSSSESEVRDSAVFCDSQETKYTLGGERRNEENLNDCQYEDNAYEEHIDGAVNVNSSSGSTISSDAQTNDTSTVISEIQEACNIDLDNKSEEYQSSVKNHKNDTASEAIETVCVTDKDKEAEHLFHLEDYNEIPGAETLRRIASEEIIVESKLDDAFNSSADDGKTEHVRVMDLDPEDELPEDQDTSNTASEIHDIDQVYTSKINGQNLSQVHASHIREAEFSLADVRQESEQTSESDEGSVSTFSHENINGFSAHESEECGENANDVNPNSEELKDELELVSNGRKSTEEQSEPKKMEKEKFMETERAVDKNLKTENNNENLVGNLPIEEKDAKADPRNTDKTDYQQRIEAIKRGREREKDRIIVERAIREARERAFAEARERAERAAVERAASEARQRAMAEAREKLDKASMEAKLKSERAAVERATSEARERALEKAISQKITQTEGKTTERVSGSSRNNGLKHSLSSSDLENVTESAQRRKARLERHQRIMERAAKALAEKNMRDLLAQKEQAERNRLAESLDTDIKRWATGKEGNMRALLSTLQYILGPGSGWQPIPLTEVVTTAAVKKAYRKATLYVHPDKVQQRGASIQQKYLCEKIFDLLKAAWNRFNSDER